MNKVRCICIGHHSFIINDTKVFIVSKRLYHLLFYKYRRNPDNVHALVPKIKGDGFSIGFYISSRNFFIGYKSFHVGG